MNHEIHSIIRISQESIMQTYTILFCLVGLLSAGPQYYSLSSYSLQPLVNLGSNYGTWYTGGYGRIQYAVPVVRYGLSTYNVDIISQTRRMAESLKATLRQLALDPYYAATINRIINEKDICINSLEEGIANIEKATSLVERAGGDIKALMAKLKTFVDLTERVGKSSQVWSDLVRESAQILRILEPLINNIAPDNISQANPAKTIGCLKSLGVLMDELANTNQLIISPSSWAQLKDSANTISAVTTFLTQLKSTFARFDICTADKQYNLDAINAIGDLMVNSADLFASLGSAQTGENLKKGKAFVSRMTVSQ